VKTDPQVEGSKVRRKKRKNRAARSQRRASFIGTRPLRFPMTLRGQQVEVEVLPVVSTISHVNFEVSVILEGKALDWVLTRAERAQIGREAGMYSEPETSH
jgi:hypothetical protein